MRFNLGFHLIFEGVMRVSRSIIIIAQTQIGRNVLNSAVNANENEQTSRIEN